MAVVHEHHGAARVFNEVLPRGVLFAEVRDFACELCGVEAPCV